jgi:hypothetical protein
MLSGTFDRKAGFLNENPEKGEKRTSNLTFSKK